MTNKINPLWSRYNWIRQVCCNPRHPEYARHGALGRTCDWPKPYSYQDFYSWIESTLGPCPAGYVLGRKDKAGDFVKSNLEWQSPKYRTRISPNTSHQITYQGVTRPLMEWSELLGIRVRTMRTKLNKGLTMEQIVQEDIKWRNRKGTTS